MIVKVKLLIKLRKKFLRVQNWVWNLVFRHFLKFALLVFLDIAQDCNLKQCLTSTRAKTSKTGPNRPKSGPKWRFPAFSFSLYWKRKDLIRFLFYCHVVGRPVKHACYILFLFLDSFTKTGAISYYNWMN